VFRKKTAFRFRKDKSMTIRRITVEIDIPDGEYCEHEVYQSPILCQMERAGRCSLYNKCVEIAGGAGRPRFHRLPECIEDGKPANIEPFIKYNFDTMPGHVWNSMSRKEQIAWDGFYAAKGIVSFGCHQCGYPIAFPGGPCEACLERNSDC